VLLSGDRMQSVLDGVVQVVFGDCFFMVILANQRISEDHVWFEDRWMVASLCDE
jgi:hypothetical protein